MDLDIKLYIVVSARFGDMKRKNFWAAVRIRWNVFPGKIIF